MFSYGPILGDCIAQHQRPSEKLTIKKLLKHVVFQPSVAPATLFCPAPGGACLRMRRGCAQRAAFRVQIGQQRWLRQAKGNKILGSSGV